MTTHKRMSILLASTMTAAGLLAGVTPAHAATTKSAEFYAGQGYEGIRFQGNPYLLKAKVHCEGIPGAFFRLRSAVNTSSSSTITLFQDKLPFLDCRDELAVLGPGERDDGLAPVGTGERTVLGEFGAAYYSST